MTNAQQQTGAPPRPSHSALKWLAAAGLVVACGAAATSANAGWIVNGVLVSNVCRAPSGAWWRYPPAVAQPVGTSCTIPTTGEPGIVTEN
jgi:anti-sigma factor RsiW